MDILGKILCAIEAVDFRCDGKARRLSASIGVIAIRAGAEAALLLQEADAACGCCQTRWPQSNHRAWVVFCVRALLGTL